MKNFYKLTILALIMTLSIGLQAKELQAYLLYATFQSPQDGPYVETYLSVVGESVNYKQLDNGKFKGVIEVTMMFKDQDAILNFAKYELNSPELDDTTNVTVNFLDIQRFALPNGDFSFDLIISDQNSDKQSVLVSQKISVNYPKEKVKLSGFELLEDYVKSDISGNNVKNGYALTPMVSNFYPGYKKNIKFYNEIYNLDKQIGDGSDCIIKTYITSFETGLTLKDFAKTKRIKAKSILPQISEFDIEKLPSGNYNLVMEIIDRENNIIVSNKVFFQRSNPDIKLSATTFNHAASGNNFVSKIETLDSLRMAVRSLAPISDQLEEDFINSQSRIASEDILRNFFFYFWKKRDALAPENEWLIYANEIRKVENSFGTGAMKGFETDRGSIYLLYGPPNTVLENTNDPITYPFIVWHYYTLGNQRDRKFVFASRDNASNNYLLIHSTAIGFINNPKWKIEISKGDILQNIDGTRKGDYWGNKIDDYWDNLR